MIQILVAIVLALATQAMAATPDPEVHERRQWVRMGQEPLTCSPREALAKLKKLSPAGRAEALRLIEASTITPNRLQQELDASSITSTKKFALMQAVRGLRHSALGTSNLDAFGAEQIINRLLANGVITINYKTEAIVPGVHIPEMIYGDCKHMEDFYFTPDREWFVRNVNAHYLMGPSQPKCHVFDLMADGKLGWCPGCGNIVLWPETSMELVENPYYQPKPGERTDRDTVIVTKTPPTATPTGGVQGRIETGPHAAAAPSGAGTGRAQAPGISGGSARGSSAGATTAPTPAAAGMQAGNTATPAPPAPTPQRAFWGVAGAEAAEGPRQATGTAQAATGGRRKMRLNSPKDMKYFEVKALLPGKFASKLSNEGMQPRQVIDPDTGKPVSFQQLVEASITAGTDHLFDGCFTVRFTWIDVDLDIARGSSVYLKGDGTVVVDIPAEFGTLGQNAFEDIKSCRGFVVVGIPENWSKRHSRLHAAIIYDETSEFEVEYPTDLVIKTCSGLGDDSKFCGEKRQGKGELAEEWEQTNVSVTYVVLRKK